jgi:hypothetical protein
VSWAEIRAVDAGSLHGGRLILSSLPVGPKP